ncbi:hypothetical protein BRADI_4g42627v3 [Brachypodium distachyon]|uniref:DUF6598 domain-containing protein n=1 Tax=Brachypodium distachyon TaxID=15368 RepID=A0A0Q3EXZ7_BRADI|nr:hypothetical protein BRADI_4g42627v3 [Brachypodium distachyon]
MLDYLVYFRREWMELWSADHAEVPALRFNQEPVPSHAGFHPALQIFSVKVIELKSIMRWPIDVFGFIAVRDALDQKRNHIFERARDNCQRVTAEDSSLVLTGPSRAVVLEDPIDFEIELRVKHAMPSQDKLLTGDVFCYNCIAHVRKAGSLKKYLHSGPRRTLEFRYAHLETAQEAAIKVWISEGSADFCAKFIAGTGSIEEKVTLLDSRDDMVPISSDGFVNFSRSAVVVKGKLIVGVEARRIGDGETSSVSKEVAFTRARSGESYGTIDVGFCKMGVVVSWSLLF